MSGPEHSNGPGDQLTGVVTDATDVAVGAGDCRVWLVDLADAPDWCEKLLHEPERQRARSFHQAVQRRRFATATALVKVTVAESTGCHPFDVTLRRECPECGGPHGRPEVVGGALHVSLSHAGSKVAVALCPDGPVGVDVEQVSDVDVESMVKLVLGDAERPAFNAVQGRAARLRAFLRCWTRKESVLKATGDGLRIPMSNVTLGPPEEPARLTGFTNRPELVGAAQLADLCPGPGYVGAVTVLSARPVRVRELDGAAAFAGADKLVRDER